MQVPLLLPVGPLRSLLTCTVGLWYQPRRGIMKGLSGLIGTKHLQRWLDHSKCSTNSSDEDDDDRNRPVEKGGVQAAQENAFRTPVASRSN